MRLDHLLSKEMEEVGVALLLICQRGKSRKRIMNWWLCAKRIAGEKTEIRTLLVAMRLGDTPVLIPNTMVKTQAADGTILETVWESRWLPDSHGGIAQLGEHLPCKQGVKGSNPFISTIAMSDNCTGDQARCKFTCMRARATGQLVRST